MLLIIVSKMNNVTACLIILSKKLIPKNMGVVGP